MINLPEVIIPDAPTAEELEAFRELMVNKIAYGNYVDQFAIEGAPKELDLQWAPTSPEEIMRMNALGYRLNNELAEHSKFITSTDADGNKKIQDVGLYTIRKEYKQARDQAYEISKQLKLDPRKTYSDVANKLYKDLGTGPAGDYKSLSETEVKSNNSVKFLNLAETELELYKDKQK